MRARFARRAPRCAAEVFTKAVVPRLREAAGRFVVVSSVAEVGEYCKAGGWDEVGGLGLGWTVLSGMEQ